MSNFRREEGSITAIVEATISTMDVVQVHHLPNPKRTLKVTYYAESPDVSDMRRERNFFKIMSWATDNLRERADQIISYCRGLTRYVYAKRPDKLPMDTVEFYINDTSMVIAIKTPERLVGVRIEKV